MANKLTKEECLIDWNNTSEDIHNLVRGVYKSPSAYFMHNDKIIKVLKTEIKADKTGVYIATKNGVLKLITVKPEGKGEMLARDWYNGVKNAK